MIRIGDKHDCSGCGACVNACPKECISLRGDGEGFLYPEADPARCVECGLCESVCPFLAATEAREPSAVYAAVNPDGQERLQSSSGGVFPLLMRAVLEQGGIVFGAAFDEDWSVHHTAVTRLEEMPALQGSKYVQSRTGTCYRAVKECLRQGKRVLFSGTACQVAGGGESPDDGRRLPWRPVPADLAGIPRIPASACAHSFHLVPGQAIGLAGLCFFHPVCRRIGIPRAARRKPVYERVPERFVPAPVLPPLQGEGRPLRDRQNLRLKHL